MKKINKIIFLFLLSIILTGCETNNKDPNAPAMLKEATGKISKAKLDNEGNIIVKEKDIKNKVEYISYDYEDINIGLLAVKDSKGNNHVVVNTCQSCGGSPYAYFVQVGDKIQCQNCGSMFDIDDLDETVEDNCNPIKIIDKKEKDGVITIGTEQLKELKDKFKNWKGPKK